MIDPVAHFGPAMGEALLFLRSPAGQKLADYLRLSRPALTALRSVETAALSGAYCDGWEGCVAALNALKTPEPETKTDPLYPMIPFDEPKAA